MNKVHSVFLCILIILVLTISCTSAPKPFQSAITPKTESQVNVEEKVEAPSEQKPKQEISAEVIELLAKSKTRVKSIYYKYRGPETGNDFYEFYVKSDKIKYLPSLEIKTLDQINSYDTIFIDRIGATAQSYCRAAHCKYSGKKEDLNYADAYILTVFDWLGGITKATKTGEEVIDDRSTWKIETNKGILWVDTFYGIPLKVESNELAYRFEQISVNGVNDADVVP